MVRSIGVNIAARAAPSTPSSGFRETRQSAPPQWPTTLHLFVTRFAYLEGGISGRLPFQKKKRHLVNFKAGCLYTAVRRVFATMSQD